MKNNLVFPNLPLCQLQNSSKKRILYPRSPADFTRITEWIAVGHSNDQIFERIQTEWRSEVTEFMDTIFCAFCAQEILSATCIECGMSDYSEYRSKNEK